MGRKFICHKISKEVPFLKKKWYTVRIIIVKGNAMSTIEAFFEEYDAKNNFVWFMRKGINVSVSFATKPFFDEMDYFGMHVTYGNKNGNDGFYFSKQVREDRFSQEISSFIDQTKMFEE